MSDAGPTDPLVTLVGKRYRCARCGTEILVTRPGTAEVACHGASMAAIELRPLPTSD